MVGRPQLHQCGICGQTFAKKHDFFDHMLNHKDQTTDGWVCKECTWVFTDSLALERHQIENGHQETYECDNCLAKFATTALLASHRRFPSPCCDAFSKKRGSYFCDACEKMFSSKASYDQHFLRCNPVPGPQPLLPKAFIPAAPLVSVKNSLDHQSQNMAPAAQGFTLPDPAKQLPASMHKVAPISQPTPPLRTVEAVASSHVCNVKGCNMLFRSQKALDVHKQDRHGVGGKGLDLAGKDSWMLSQHARQQLKDAGVFRPGGASAPRPRFSPAIPSSSARHPPPRASNITPQVIYTVAPLTSAAMPPRPSHHHHPQDFCSGPPPLYQLPPHQPIANLPMEPVGVSPDEGQANKICEQIMRLILQSNLVISKEGHITYTGIKWTRVSYDKQSDIVGMFSGLCHLPAILQSTEYTPPPKSFMDEYKLTYPVTDFELSPKANSNSLKIIAVSCIKIILQDGLQEAVKIAAVDVVSCRVLMNHLICTHPITSVKNWCTNVTGLSSYQDVEEARKDGYKVLKGWSAARAALWKFIDRDTIIVGHNLRSDLDTLRMIHGRAIDVAKIFENAAKGPLSKQQVGLESLCRDLLKIGLVNHPIFSRDALQNALAARELGLWMLKNKDKVSEIAKEKARCYSLIAPQQPILPVPLPSQPQAQTA